jgi:hypothetical protein
VHRRLRLTSDFRLAVPCVVVKFLALATDTMSFYKPFRVRLRAWADWFALALISFAAPLIAAYIHSLYVFERGFRLYNAEIGGIYFHGSMPPYPPPVLSLVDYILALIGACGIPAIPTFLVLLAFRKRALYYWLVWAGFIALWTWLLFQMEIAIH